MKEIGTGLIMRSLCGLEASTRSRTCDVGACLITGPRQQGRQANVKLSVPQANARDEEAERDRKLMKRWRDDAQRNRDALLPCLHAPRSERQPWK
jgi:hypothetical protein